MHRQLGPMGGGLLATLHPTGGSGDAVLATDGGGSRTATDGGGSRRKSAMVIEAVTRTQAAIVRDSDAEKASGTTDEVRGPDGSRPAARASAGAQASFRRRDAAVRIELATTELMTGFAFELDDEAAAVSHGAGKSKVILYRAHRPANTLLRWQAASVLARSPKRADRLPEIYVQMDDVWPFWQALTRVDEVAAPRTMELLHVSLQFATRVVMQVKQLVDCPRPSEVNDLIVPMIDMPGHGSLPSGHATSAFMLSGVLQALLGLRGKDGHLMSQLLRRLAFRVAYNREVAGVHYPIDSLAGRLLGMTLAEFMCAAAGDGTGAFAGAAFDTTKWGETNSQALARANEDTDVFDKKAFPGIGQAVEHTLTRDHDYLVQMWGLAREELGEHGLVYGPAAAPAGAPA